VNNNRDGLAPPSPKEEDPRYRQYIARSLVKAVAADEIDSYMGYISSGSVQIIMLLGYLEKLSFCPNAALRVKILSSEYQLYACGKIFTRALILNQNPHFARYPLF
jgi:hypothetical protein